MNHPLRSGRISLVIATLVAALCVSGARANLLSASYESQLEAWLGQGDLAFTSVFTKVAGDGKMAADFHAAADGQGPTFTLMSITTDLPGAQVIGGYNPQSWFGNPTFAGSLNYVPGGSAFIYNLSDGRVQYQNSSYWGPYQTFNFASWGPSFGAGNDFYADTSLQNGLAFTMSYGNDGRSITNGADAYLYYDYYSIARIEVYTFAAAETAAVPESGAVLGVMGAFLAGLAGLRQRVSLRPAE